MSKEFLLQKGVFNFKYIPFHNSNADKSKIKNKMLNLETMKSFAASHSLNFI